MTHNPNAHAHTYGPRTGDRVHHGLDPRHMLRSFMSRATRAEAEMS